MPSTLGALLGLYGLDPTTGRTQTHLNGAYVLEVDAGCASH